MHPEIKNFIPNQRNSSNGYNLTSDTIYMQPINMFKTDNHYYSTLFHEMIHSTGHDKRLNRLGNGSLEFGSPTYAKEELIADLGAAFLMSEAGLNINYKNKAAYIQNWLKPLKNDNRLIVIAAGNSEKAVNHINNNNKDKTELNNISNEKVA